MHRPLDKNPTNFAVRTIVPRWILAGTSGITVAVTLAAKAFDGMPPAMGAFLSIFVGWCVMMILVPWRGMLAAQHQVEALHRLTRALKSIDSNLEDHPSAGDSLPEALLQRNDAFGELARTVHDLTLNARATARESRRLRRSMDKKIEQETDRRTVSLEKKAATDVLTGLGNRRVLERLSLELFGEPGRRRADSIVAMAIDVDLFKEVNDTLGHDVGDEVLVFLGELLRSTLRHDDHPLRLGGDEFVVLMPQMTLESATAVAERICALFKQMPWPHGRTSRPTISIGLADSLSVKASDARSLIRAADLALYDAKRAGRGCVITANAA